MKTKTISNIPGLAGIAVTESGEVFASSNKEHSLLSMKEGDLFRGTETIHKVGGGSEGHCVRQENVRSKTKELTGTLLYALSMHSVITASSEDCHAKQKMLMSYCRVELCGCKLFTTIRMSLL